MSAPAQSGETPGHVDPDLFARRLETEGWADLETTFRLTAEEAPLLDPAHGDGRAKNISLGRDGVRGATQDPAARLALEGLLARYGAWAEATLIGLAPRYGPDLARGRASLRTRAVDEPAPSLRKDDRRLHVDAFASSPTGGRRILRVFTNINPAGEARHWSLGEPFEDHARRWLSGLRRPLPFEAALLQAVGVTRARRTPYDVLMLGLHDKAKLDQAYQDQAPARDVFFPAGASWLVYTDSVVHAALAGRFALEQTFYLPPEAMADPAASPLRILERLTGRSLT
jgi:hypothetical protein